MADTALFITWDKTTPGREEGGLALFEAAVGLYESFVQDGRLESYELGFPEPHGRPLTAFALLRGTAQSIGQIQASDEFQRLLAQAYVVTQGLSVSRAAIGEGIAPYLERYTAALADVVPGTAAA